MMLKIKYNIDIDVLTLNSYYENPVSDEVLEKIRLIKDDINDILKNVTIVDNVHNPTGLYNTVRDYALKNGKEVKEEVVTDDGNKLFVTKDYIPNDPDKFTIVVADHISLLEPETDSLTGKKLTDRESMAKWSSHYCLKHITKRFKFVVINVQQVAMNTDDAFHRKNKALEPEISDAANNKEILRDDHLIFSLFAPDRYDIKNYKGYDITKLGDSYRSIKILKNRFGISNAVVPTFFEGATGRFEELPVPKVKTGSFEVTENPDLKRYYKKK